MNNSKTIALTGATGDLAKTVCLKLASLGYNFIFINRNAKKSEAFADFLKSKFKDIKIEQIVCDLTNLEDVKKTINILKTKTFEALILNSGIYNVKLHQCDSGYNNVFQVNFLSQYLLARKLMEEKTKFKKVIVLGSIAHNYSKLDELDVDFSFKTKPSLVYGNSKRFLMFAFYELFKK